MTNQDQKSLSGEIIGVPLVRADAYSKAAGTALYTGDIRLPGCLEAKALRSPLAHAKIVNLDAHRARNLPGVMAVLTGKDLQEYLFGQGIVDQPVLAVDRVRFVGERVAAVAAKDSDTALEALDRIRIDYEELPAITEPIAAMQTGSVLVHPLGKAYGKGQFYSIPNVAAYNSYGIGDLSLGFGQADLVLEHSFRTQVVHQGYLEPHVCIVQLMGKSVRVWSNNKSPFELRGQLAVLLGLPESAIEVVYNSIGGDFGGKGALMDEPICYYLALSSGCPVRMSMTLREELLAANPRHAAVVTLKSGLLADGTITARQAKVIFDTGAYAGANSHPMLGGLRRVLGAYRIPHTRVEGYAVYTNKVPAGHCRAPGDPQVFFAVESHTDMLAAEVGLDPYEFRKKNILLPGDISPSGQNWQGINALEVLDTAINNSGWRQPKTTPYCGRGMAVTERRTGLGASAALLSIHRDGSATVVSGATDPGSGSHTVLRQIAARELQLPLEKVTFCGGSTGMAPFDNGSGSSRVTHVTGQAVSLAARDALLQIKELAATLLEVPSGSLDYHHGAFSLPSGDRVSLREILSRAGREKNVVVGRGTYVAEGSETTCFSAQVAEVLVDPDTGQVSVEKVVAANDIGFALNPAAAQGQVEGAVVQGMGFALNEELPYPGGRPSVNSLADYKLATILDAPLVEGCLVEGAAGPGPFGAKSIGEQAIAAVAPAIANAIYDAVGVRLCNLPMTPEKIKMALGIRERGRA